MKTRGTQRCVSTAGGEMIRAVKIPEKYRRASQEGRLQKARHWQAPWSRALWAMQWILVFKKEQ